ncbi:unnamed protein product [Aspergillus oryzae]|uniref:Unnamed protein product n=2 Tax=Aspergillus oryzae TaxID=5062 RepID=A0AAN4YT47_ASPOZ|nr:unnamed protein product [Aspergillus oryzae]GMF92507.1 unnamed protein product [Aspergillus oryzae]GMG03232.1 unnamed protein product [Aspergillus oryzae]GMG36024.1 unnamed protein product [Aspergillus oryzae]GMG46231.1 unnamed protein product [Aspergillus oryzae var. brunneus]
MTSVEKAGGSSPATAIENEKSISNSASGSTIAPPAGKEQGTRPSSSHKSDRVGDNNDDDDALYSHLPEHEKQILKKQLDADERKVPFVALFRYASRMDILIMFISAICAIAAGAALPLFTVCLN